MTTYTSCLRTLRIGRVAGLLLAGVLLAACAGADESTAPDDTADESPADAADTVDEPAADAADEPVDEADAELGNLTTQFHWIKNVEYAGWYVAMDEGLFEESRLEGIELVGGGPNSSSPEASVAGGNADVGVASALRPIIDAINEGEDFVILSAQYQDHPGGLLSLADDPVRTPEDLVGKRICGQQGTETVIEAVFTLNGLEPDYDFVTVGFGPEPLIEGDCEAYNGFMTNQPLILDEQGVDYETVLYTELGYPTYGNIIFAKRETVEERRDALVAYLAALERGWELNEQDAERAARLTVEEHGQDLGLEIEHQVAVNEAQIPLVRGDLTDHLLMVSEDEIGGPMYEALRALGRTDLPEVSEVVDTSVLEDAQGQ